LPENESNKRRVMDDEIGKYGVRRSDIHTVQAMAFIFDRHAMSFLYLRDHLSDSISLTQPSLLQYSPLHYPHLM
jgi:hypothetical protein